MNKRMLGARFSYSPEVERMEVRTNKPAFASLFSNVVGNAVQYAFSNSLIKALAYLSSRDFIFELENMVSRPIDAEEIRHIFEKGYRMQAEVHEENIFKRNEGLGLYFSEKVVRRGFNGRIDIASDHTFKITDERTTEMKEKEYGQPYPKSSKSEIPSLPSFHAKISIPLEALVE